MDAVLADTSYELEVLPEMKGLPLACKALAGGRGVIRYQPMMAHAMTEILGRVGKRVGLGQSQLCAEITGDPESVVLHRACDHVCIQACNG
jgi:hypothetical protein